MSKKAFVLAVSELGSVKGLTKEQIKEAIVDSFVLALNKKIEGEYKVEQKSARVKKLDRLILKDKEDTKLPEALIKVDVDLDKASIKLYRQYKVLNDEDITDDYIEMSIDKAREYKKTIKAGEYLDEEIPFESLTKKDVDRFVTNFKQKISSFEKEILLEQFADKIGQIVTGIVEKADSHSVIVNLGKTTVTMFRNDLIGDEKFQTGDTIKVYVRGLKKDETKKTSLIDVSRSCPEFLGKLFENEVIEIQDGIVEIKAIARISGKRSKVVVLSHDPNVDPSGACIGKNGERIQRIVSQLGNTKDSKEKVDVILYHHNLGAYLYEILKPAEVIGVNIDEENNQATVITRNGTMKLAVGTHGQNLSLARRLTGLNFIKVLDESEMEKEGISSYKPIEEYLAEDEAERREEERKRFRENNIRQSEAKRLQNDNVIEEEPINEVNETPSANLEENVKEFSLEEPSVEEVKETKEEKEEVVPEVKKKVVEPVELREVKTTTTLEMLEQSLEEEKKQKEEASKAKKNNKKKENKVEEEDLSEKKPIKKMDIYTEEELKELDDQDEDDDYYDDEEDWSEYDNDDYYEDK